MVESQRFHHGPAQLSPFWGKASMLPSTVRSKRTQGIQFPGSGVENLTADQGTVCPKPAVVLPPGIQTDLGAREKETMDTRDSSPGAGLPS